MKEKSRITNNLKYGGNSSMCSEDVKKKSKETSRKNHGVDWYTQSNDFKIKSRKTMILKYGIEHTMHYTPHFEKSLDTSYRKKYLCFLLEESKKYKGTRDLL